MPDEYGPFSRRQTLDDLVAASGELWGAAEPRGLIDEAC
jgi:hypothetical protein